MLLLLAEVAKAEGGKLELELQQGTIGPYVIQYPGLDVGGVLFEEYWLVLVSEVRSDEAFSPSSRRLCYQRSYGLYSRLYLLEKSWFVCIGFGGYNIHYSRFPRKQVVERNADRKVSICTL